MWCLTAFVCSPELEQMQSSEQSVQGVSVTVDTAEDNSGTLGFRLRPYTFSIVPVR